MSKDDIFTVLLVGGSSLIPDVQNHLAEYFEGIEVRECETDTIAAGAAILATIIADNYVQ